ncbi:MAG: N-acetylneuraminate synthase [Candidatus Marinimicrobia bacterium]|nr:N-acetylneuraminate synthase [Candidatus Neomarinimicrobiota bacterium]
MEIEISGRKIGDGHPVFFIAEAGVNHNGSIELGKKLIDVAIDAGADAVKFQTFKTENIITPDAPKSTYHVETMGDDKSQSWFDLLKTQEMSRDMHIELIEHCKKNGIVFLSTPYDEESADLLEQLDIPAFKIASTDTNNTPLLRHIARKGRPMIISTAMATMAEVEGATAAVRDEGLEDIVVLQCTGNYPSRLEDSNLRVMLTYKNQLNCLVGYSDHTPDLINPVAATALGATVYEKHFTIDKGLPGPDHRMSLSPEELKKTVQAIRKTERVMGSSVKIVLPDEEENRLKLRKSIVTNCNIKKDQIIDKAMLGIKRPGNGIPPSEIERYIGKKAKHDILSGTVVTHEMIYG